MDSSSFTDLKIPIPDDFFIMTKQLGILKLGYLTGLIINDNQVLIEMTLKRDFSWNHFNHAYLWDISSHPSYTQPSQARTLVLDPRSKNEKPSC